MNRVFARLQQLPAQMNVSRQTAIAVFFSVIMVTSMAAPAYAAGSGDSTQESLSSGSIDDTLQLSNNDFPSFNLRHSESFTRSFGGTNDSYASSIIVENATDVFEPSDRAFEISSADSFTVSNTDTDFEAVIFFNEDEFESINVTQVDFANLYTAEGELKDEFDIEVETVNEDGSTTIESYDALVEPHGEESDFAMSNTFSNYTVEYTSSDADESISTDNRLVGIGYKSPFEEFDVDDETDEINVSIPRDAEVDASWFTNYVVQETGENTDTDIEIEEPIENDPTTDFFNFTVDVSDLSNGEYTVSLRFFVDEPDDENFAASNQILSVTSNNIQVDREDEPDDGSDGEPLPDDPSFSSENVSIYDRSPLPLRVDTATAATQLSTPDPTLRVTGEGTDNLNKPEIGVFNTGEDIDFEFRERGAAPTPDVFDDGQETQFVTARVDEMPEDFDEMVDLVTLQSPTAEEYTVEDAAPIDDGVMDHTTQFDRSGYYITYVVAVEEGDGLGTTDDGSLFVDGNVQVAGIDTVAVQSAEASIEQPSEVQRGDEITVDVPQPENEGDEEGINHLLVAYHEDTFTNQDVEFITDTDDFDTISEENISIERSVEYINGVGQFDADVSVFGMSTNSDRQFDGQIPVGSIFNELANETGLEQIENESTDDEVLDISATSAAELDDGSISVETLPDWTTGEYRLLYVAQEDGEVSNFATVDDTVDIIDEELEAAISAEPTDADVNVTEVEFDASDTQGSVTEYQWDFTGDGEVDEVTDSPTVAHIYEVSELGDYEPQVTAVSPEGDEDDASTTVTVEDTVPPTAVLDLRFDGESIVDSVVAVGERFEADASESTDNHRLDTPYNWEIIDSDGETVADDSTLEDVTSFRLDEPGEYTAEVTVVDESGNENTTAESFEVVDESLLDAEIDADNEQRLQDGLNGSVTVTNIGNTETTDGFNWTLTASGDSFDDEEQETLTLDGDDESTFEPEDSVTLDEFDDDLTDWAQDNRIVGDVDLEFEIDSDSRTSNDSTTVDVTYSNLETDATSRDGIEGLNVSLRSFIENTGTAAADDSTAAVTVENSSEEEVFSEELSISELSSGDTQRDRLRTSFDEADDYTLNVSVEDELFPENSSAESEFTIDPYDLDIVSTTAPDTVESGDRFTLRMTYSTNASEPVNASLNVSETEGLSVTDEQGDLRERSPSAGSNDTVTWRVRADEFVDDGYDLEFEVDSAVDGLDESDTETISIDSERRTETRTEESSTVLNIGEDNASTELQFYNDSTSVSHNTSITAQGGSDGRTLQGLEYLVQYPYGCVEQTTSAFLGALNTQQYYDDRDDYNLSDNPDRFDRINDSIAQGVERLNETGERAQLDDGSWNMWGQDNREGETFFTMYATYGLSEVENDETYSELNADGLDDIDFDEAVTWMQQDQDEDGSFDARYYINDDPATTGFAMVSLAQANETHRVTGDTRDNITEIYANGAEYLIENQEDGSWNNDNDKSTALAVWGLQIALDANAYEESAEIDDTDIETAIDDGSEWLAAEQQDDGSWSPYHNSPSWNAIGDTSETTAYATLALDAANKEIGAVDDAAQYLTETYESQGSWGYPRATAVSIEALIQTTEGAANQSVDVTFSNSTSDVTIEDIEVTPDNPDVTEELSDSENSDLRDLLDSTEGTIDVTVDQEESPKEEGTVIIGIENTQEVDLDVLEGGDN